MQCCFNVGHGAFDANKAGTGSVRLGGACHVFLLLRLDRTGLVVNRVDCDLMFWILHLEGVGVSVEEGTCERLTCTHDTPASRP